MLDSEFLPDSFFKGKSPLWQGAFLILLVILSVSVFTLISIPLIEAFWGYDSDSLSQIYKDPKGRSEIGALKLVQLFSSIGMFLVPSLLFVYLTKHDASNWLNLNFGRKWINYIIAIAAVASSAPLINWLMEMNSAMALPEFMSGLERIMRESEDKATELTHVFLEMETGTDLLINIILVGAIPAISEELFFRGVIQRLFSEWTDNIHVAVISSAILFSAFHIQFYGFFPRMMLGMMFGYMLFWSGSLWVPIVAHFFQNAVQVLLVYLYQKGSLDINLEDDFSFGILQILTSSIVFAGFMFIIYKSRKDGKGLG